MNWIKKEEEEFQRLHAAATFPRICACRAAPSGPEQVRRRELRGCAHIVSL